MFDLFSNLAYLHKGGSGNDDLAKNLLSITDECDPEMHEPDNVGVSARVDGDHLDNSGSGPEFKITLFRPPCGARKKAEKFTVNLATLIAYARIGAALAVASEPIETTAAHNKYARGR